MTGILRTVKTLNLPDWWVCAGFVRAKIWDTRHGYGERTALPDIDVIYFDPGDDSEGREKELEDLLTGLHSGIPWSVKNQVRMHHINHNPPYSSARDAMSKFPETATALGLTLSDENGLVLYAPWGVEDAVNGVIRPTPFFREDPDRLRIYRNRLLKKNWKQHWERLTILDG